MRIAVNNEYGLLRRCLACPPIPLTSWEPINSTQAFYFSTIPPDFDAMRRQHLALADLLLSAAVEIDYPPPSISPFQLFTRDIGFVIGERFFLASMKKAIRQQETSTTRLWLAKNGIRATECPVESIEGGDILVDFPFVYIGIGTRTSIEAAEWLEGELTTPWQIIRVETKPSVLHLDCVLNVIASDTILYCPSLIGNGRRLVEERYSRRVEITEQEAFEMACNVLALGASKILIEMSQSQLQSRLAAQGFQAICVDWGEIRKFGGLFRCAVCPLEREITNS